VLSEQDRAEFAERGVVWLRGAFGTDEGGRMRRRVWVRLTRLGVAEDDPITQAAADVTGLSKAIKRDRVFAAPPRPWSRPGSRLNSHMAGRPWGRDAGGR
jgi:hypothetical protein